MARTKKQTTSTQYAWAANGYMPDSRYKAMPHTVLTPKQYACRTKHSKPPARVYLCSYQPRIGANEGRLLPSIKVHANSAEQAARIATQMLHRPIILTTEDV